ncbi:MAG: SpoVA/SpoVAEb family sporulation membrane protein [Otoolea sp.]
MEVRKDQYGEYVKEVTPVHNTWKNVFWAFLIGGFICFLGQMLQDYLQLCGLEKDAASAWTLLTLVFASVLLTGLNQFQKLARFAGAGVLVPITGFANSVAAPALENKVEGQVFGIGCKIFTISGPVILYGVFTSWVLGVIYWIGMMMGM